MSEALVSTPTLSPDAALAIWDRTVAPVRTNRDAARDGDAHAWPKFEAGLDVLRELRPLLYASVVRNADVRRIADEFIQLEDDFFRFKAPVPWPDENPGEQAVS